MPNTSLAKKGDNPHLNIPSAACSVKKVHDDIDYGGNNHQRHHDFAEFPQRNNTKNDPSNPEKGFWNVRISDKERPIDQGSADSGDSQVTENFANHLHTTPYANCLLIIHFLNLVALVTEHSTRETNR